MPKIKSMRKKQLGVMKEISTGAESKDRQGLNAVQRAGDSFFTLSEITEKDQAFPVFTSLVCIAQIAMYIVGATQHSFVTGVGSAAEVAGSEAWQAIYGVTYPTVVTDSGYGWTYFTSGFGYPDIWTLLVGVLLTFFLGNVVERRWQWYRVLMLFVTGTAAAGIAYAYSLKINNLEGVLASGVPGIATLYAVYTVDVIALWDKAKLKGLHAAVVGVIALVMLIGYAIGWSIVTKGTIAALLVGASEGLLFVPRKRVLPRLRWLPVSLALLVHAGLIALAVLLYVA